MFEQARWISRHTDMQMHPAPLLRKSFTVDRAVRCATLHICGLGLGSYTLNGSAVTQDVMTTPHTCYDKTLLYTSYDVTALLQGGENVLGVMLGSGNYFITFDRWDYYKPAWNAHPKLIAQLSLEYADGTGEEIVSDTSWKTADSPIVYNETKRGETYDARLEQEGWDTPRFNDEAWERAHICRSPGGVLHPSDCPPMRVVQTLPAKKIGMFTYDFGLNLTGWVRLCVRGSAGATLRLRYAETVNEVGEIHPERLNNIVGAATHQDTYILRGSGSEEHFAPRFAYHGFRYVELVGDPVDFVALTAEVVHTVLPVVGKFSCSDPFLNRLHDMVHWSTLGNIHQGVVTDCPQREQNGWTGDAQLSAEQSLMNYDMTALYRKWLRDFADVQRPTGQIPGIVPSPGWGYNWGSGVAWDCALILIPYYIYQYTGDKSVIEERFENMARLFDFMQSMEEDGIVDYGLGEWCAPEDAEACPVALTETAYYYYCARIMADCARLLGKDNIFYSEHAAVIKAAFRDKYIKDGVLTPPLQTAYACALYYGLFEENEYAAAVARLASLVAENDYHTTCGILGMKCIYTVLTESGYGDVVYRMISNPTAPSFAYWVQAGMTTLCECWNLSGSWNHHMYSEVDLWLYKYVAGIRATSPGFQTVDIIPIFLEGLQWVHARHGDIEVSWDTKTVTVKTPVPARLCIGDKIYPIAANTTKVVDR